jgi:selenocysteine-specific elongation factor
MRVIGTAGHVDHGKSTLVKALTGTDPDRLKEEKDRQMTIDLGFAWYQDAAGQEISIVDVPGHRDFMENMLAGIGGIELVLLVIAADEGVMPQTREHMAVLDLLKIKNGIVVLTKVDLVNDKVWLELVEEDIREKLTGTSLEGAQIMRVSAVTGEGLDELKKKISDLFCEIKPPPDKGKPRLPIDRVFSIAGFGTVVTGTLLNGQLAVGDQVEIFPPAKTARIRGIQTHKKQAQTVPPGSRAAINLVGVEPGEIQRGSMLFHPGDFHPTFRIDTRVEVLPESEASIQNNDEVKLFIGTAESSARTRLLGTAELHAGESGFIQFELKQELIICEADRFILRRMSPATTLGGGVVLDAHPIGRHKLRDERVQNRLESLMNPTNENQLYKEISETPFISFTELRNRLSIEKSILEKILDSQQQQGKVISIEPDLFISTDVWEQLTKRTINRIERFHQSFPLLIGIPIENLASFLSIDKSLFDRCIQRWEKMGILELVNNRVRRHNRQVKYSPAQQTRIDALMHNLTNQPNNPPSVKVSREELGDDVYASLVDQGILIQVSSEVVLSKEEYQAMREYVVEECQTRGSISVAGFRDHFATSRKVSLGLLEHLDARGITLREGDVRVIKTKG